VNEGKIAIGSMTLDWRVQERMKEVGIRSIAELHAKVKDIDPGAVEYSRFSPVVQKLPARLTVRTLLAIALALNCDVGDLLRVRPTQ
jgi:hypothetical protein